MTQDITDNAPSKINPQNDNIKTQATEGDLKFFTSLLWGIVLLWGICFFCEYYPFSQGPPAPSTQNLLELSLLISMPIIAGSISILAVPIVLIGGLFTGKTPRIRFFLFSTLPVICLLIQVGLYNIMPQFKHNACLTIVSHGQVLVDAISSYQYDHNSYPENLEALVPTYINKIPETGIRGFPYFEYEILNPAEYKYPIPEMGDKPIYELRVNLERLFKWDRVFYWPTKKYPDLIYGGGVEKIGKWAYVNE
jgi:hypothetical protein